MGWSGKGPFYPSIPVGALRPGMVIPVAGPHEGVAHYDPRLDAFVINDHRSTTLLGHPSSYFTQEALERACAGDLKLAFAEHRRGLLLETRPSGEVLAGPGMVDALHRVRIDGQEVEVGHTAGRDRRPWWRRVFS